MTSFPIDYPESDHERVIGEYFSRFRGKRTPNPSISPGQPRNHSHFVICFVNRSGSNLLARALMSSKQFGRAGEYFNHPQVTRFSGEWGMRSLEDYASATRSMRTAANGVFGTKLAWSQLYYLTKEGIIPRVFTDTKFILIERRDVLAQAISFSIAFQTKAWTSETKRKVTDYQFDPQDILRRIRGISEAYSRFKQYFAVFGIEPVYVLYEELERDVAGTVQRVIEELAMPGTDGARVDMAEISLQRQRGQLNEVVQEQFLAYTDAQLSDTHWPKVAPPSSR